MASIKLVWILFPHPFVQTQKLWHWPVLVQKFQQKEDGKKEENAQIKGLGQAQKGGGKLVHGKSVLAKKKSGLKKLMGRR